MFELSRKEQQQARASKTVQKLDKLTTNLRMDELVQPITLVNIQNAIRETFREWARKVKPNGDGEKIYVCDAMRILQEVSRTWARLYRVVADSRDEELRASSDMCAQ